MNYLRWHYFSAPKFIFYLTGNYLYFIGHIFSVKLLAKTLLSPWRKEVAKKTKPGFNLQEIIDTFSFNIISRILGFIVRISALFASFIFLIIVVLLGSLLFILWFLIPIFSLPVYLMANKKESPEEKNKFLKAHLEEDPEPDDIENVSAWYEKAKEEEKKERQFWTKENLLAVPGIGRYWAYGYTPFLDQLTIDLSQEDFPLEKLVGRKNQINQLQRALEKENNNNVFLVGEPGVGRKTIVTGLAKLIDAGKCLRNLLFKRVLLLDLQRLVSQNQAETESSLANVLEEARQAENIILVIPSIDQFIKDSHINLTQVLSTHLAGKNLQVIGITDPASYQKYILPSPSLLKIFEKVEVEEISKDEALEVLQNYSIDLEKKYKIMISYQALEEIIKQSYEIITGIPFPEKAIDLLEDSLVFVREAGETKLLAKNVDEVLSEKTKLPLGELSQQEKDKLENLEKILHQRIVGQDIAVEKISQALRRKRAGVKTKNSPSGTFLFLGPTGVGKTETAKALAQAYFGNEEKIIRLDMSEFQNDNDIGKLIGDKDNPGLLTSSVRQNPFTVLLLDEFEKADSKIINIFLTILDEAYVYDGQGKKVSFKNTFIIATSNAGSEFIRENLEANPEASELEKSLTNYLLRQNIFSPELLNRFDAVIFYKPLTKLEIEKIAKFMIDKLNKKLKEEKDITIRLSKDSMAKLIDKGYDPLFGARNLQRAIEEDVENKIAERLLKDDIKGSEIEIVL